jgi:hypothetical protein
LRLRLFLYLSLALCPVVAGCGSGTWGTASGTVTLEGTPLKDGVITFHPGSEQAPGVGQVKDGEFTVTTGQKEGLKVGKYKVTVSARTIPKEGTNEQPKWLTPPKYARPETTDLEADVKSGSNKFTFEMKGKVP